MATVWCMTVFGVTPSRRAISLFVSPATMSCTTCSCRSVSPGYAAQASWSASARSASTVAGWASARR